MTFLSRKLPAAAIELKHARQLSGEPLDIADGLQWVGHCRSAGAAAAIQGGIDLGAVECPLTDVELSLCPAPYERPLTVATVAQMPGRE